MPYATTDDRVKLWYEETGAGQPIVFVHEFAADHRSWEPQMRHFGQRYRCITFSARGYPPSDVPEKPESYSQNRATDDIAAVMDHLKIDKAHVVGLSMGGFATLHFGFRHPSRALSLVVAGCGYGAEKDQQTKFRAEVEVVAKALKEEGYRIVLVNSNPATIMTDPDLADATYIEPITPEIVAKIIEKERPDALLPTMGGQTALNCALSLKKMGVLDKFNIKMIGATADAIDKAEDRELFRDAMTKIGLETPRSHQIKTLAQNTKSKASALNRATRK